MKYYDLVSLEALPSQRWVVDGVLPDQGLAVLYGMPGCGKTFVALDLGLRISNRMAWCGKAITRPGIVVYVMAEGVCGIKARINAWHASKHIHPEASFVVMPLTFNVCVPEQAAEFLRILLGIRETYGDDIVLIIFDTFARMAVGLDENSSKDVSVIIRAADNIRDTLGCSVLFVHHGGKDCTRGMRGSSSLLGAVDTCIKTSRYDGTMQIELYVEKQKDGSPASFRMDLSKYGDSAVVLPHKHGKTSSSSSLPPPREWQMPQYKALAMAVKTKDVYEISRDFERAVSDIRVAVYHLVHEHASLSKEDIMKHHHIAFPNVLPARILNRTNT